MYDVSTRWREFKANVNKRPVTMQVRPLKNWAYMLLLPLMVGGPRRQPEETIEQFIARLTAAERDALNRDAVEVQKVMLQVWPEHVRGLSGVTVDGQSPTTEQLAEEVAFMALANAVAIELMSITDLGEASEKNSGAPSASLPPGSGSAQMLMEGRAGGGSISSTPATNGDQTEVVCEGKESGSSSPETTFERTFPR